MLIGLIYCTAMVAAADNLKAKDYANMGMQHAAAFPGLANLCDINSPFKIAGLRTKRPSNQDKPKKKKNAPRTIAATKVFDNLYFVGNGGVSSWVIETSEGLILVDALKSNGQAKKYIETGMRKLGLNPADIKYLIVTHGHGDHYGGQEHFVKNYGVKVVMSDIEWTRLERPRLDIENPRWGVKPKRDISINDGDVIKLGNTDVKIHVTPGHTPGTISLLFPVFDQGKKHVVSLWGGTGLNYGPVEDRILEYSQAAKKFGEHAKQAGVDVYISNHPKRDGSAEKLKAMQSTTKTTQHPFVIGKEQALKAFEMLHQCTYAQVLRIREGLK